MLKTICRTIAVISTLLIQFTGFSQVQHTLGLSVKDLGLRIPQETMPYGFGRMEGIEDPPPAMLSYLDELLLKDSPNIDLRDSVKINSPELALQNGVIDSLLTVYYQLGKSRLVTSRWADKKFGETFYDYYKFQKDIYGTLKGVTIKQMFCSSPFRKNGFILNFLKWYAKLKHKGQRAKVYLNITSYAKIVSDSINMILHLTITKK